ncbi:MAG TPA: tetratricopeptide repeat protein [Verrucomicrobiae bacterium]|nr:tetratricopeptide repeat protein [Verrucomicrobiae bacterium]
MSCPRQTILLLVLITLLAYLPVTHDGFSCYDDDQYVTENLVVQNGLTWAGLHWAFTTWDTGNWHPLTWLSHMLDCELFGLNGGAQHFVNVLFHAANAVLLLSWLRRLTGRPWPSAFVAALFAWHPLHVESVAWISERKDVLSTFFEILALLAYTRYAQSSAGDQQPLTQMGGAAFKPARPQATRSRSRYFWLAVISHALGLMAKPMLVTLPFLLLLLDYWPLQRFSGGQNRTESGSTFKLQHSNLLRLIAEKWPFFALTVVSCVVTFQAQDSTGAVASLAGESLTQRFGNTPVAYAHYLLKMFWPVHLVVFYPLNPLSGPVVVAAALALAAISGLVWRLRRTHPYGLVGWFWFLGMLVPVIGLVQVGSAAVADRYTYFPSIGIFLAVALGLTELAERFRVPKSLTVGTASLVLLACLALTEHQLRYWQDDVSLFSHAIACTKDNDIAYLNLGSALEREGRIANAMDATRRALAIQTNRAQTHNNLANLLSQTGHPDEALAEYQAALRINPNYGAAHENLGTLFLSLGQFEDAMRQYAEAARLDPTDWRAPYFMGKTLLSQGRDVEAVSRFQQALRIAPRNFQVLSYTIQVLASDENPKVRDGHAAFRMASRGIALTGGTQPEAFDLLAMACAELGHFEDAANAEQHALEIAGASGLTNDIASLQEREQLYQNHRPLRQSFTNAR